MRLDFGNPTETLMSHLSLDLFHLLARLIATLPMIPCTVAWDHLPAMSCEVKSETMGQ